MDLTGFIVALSIVIFLLGVLAIVSLLLQIHHEIQAIRLELLLRKKKYYEAAKYAFSKRFLCTEEFNTEKLDSSTIKTFYETLYAYAKFKCCTDGIMTISDVSDAIYYLFGDSFGKEVEPQVNSAINNSIFISFVVNINHFWFSSYFTSGLLLLFLVENETITLTKEIPFEKIITGKFEKDEILDVIDKNSKLFTKIKETKEE